MVRDLQLAIRRFRFKPAHTALLIVILGVGIGAATAVFSVVDQTILRPPPFAHPDRLVEVLDLYRSAGARSTSLTPQKIAGWQAQPSLFEGLEAYASREFDLTGEELEPERVRGLIVSNGLLGMLGVQPSFGRGFAGRRRPSGRRARRAHQRWTVAAQVRWPLGHTWDAHALSDEQHTIVGVMPRRFRLTGEGEDLWLPIDVRSGGGIAAPPRFVGIGRVAPGVDPRSQQQIADTLAARMQGQTPLPTEPYWDIHLSRKKVASVADTTEIALFVLLGAVGFVLLITCANTANLFLSQIGVRQHEMAVRAAIGASRPRLFREVLTESVVLAVCGGALGMLVATWGVGCDRRCRACRT